MSLTLGEKLRQAREERGLSISEVAEQTRISALYLESIENNDYRILPGGIFNKGFVKSYAKHVGIDEQEALRDYAALIVEQGSDVNDDPKTYRPEVLTDEQSRSGLLPTVIFAGLIIGLIIWGVLAFLKNNPFAQSDTVVNANVNQANQNAEPIATATPFVSTNEIKVEFKSLSEPFPFNYWVDGKPQPPKKLSVGETFSVAPQQSVRFAYYRSFTPDKLELTVNGKKIPAPNAPAKGVGIAFEITKENIGRILQNGVLTNETAATTATASTTASAPVRTATPRPTATRAASPTATPTPRVTATPTTPATPRR